MSGSRAAEGGRRVPGRFVRVPLYRTRQVGDWMELNTAGGRAMEPQLQERGRLNSTAGQRSSTRVPVVDLFVRSTHPPL